MAYKKPKRRYEITDEIYKKMQSRNQLWTNEAYDQSEDLARQFKDNIIYMCEKRGVTIKDTLRWLREMGLNFNDRRLYKWGNDHAIYPSLVEITFFSKYFELDPGVMISKDLRTADKLRSLKK